MMDSDLYSGYGYQLDDFNDYVGANELNQILQAISNSKHSNDEQRGIHCITDQIEYLN